MTYDHELTLINYETWMTNAIGHQVPVISKTKVLCALKSIGQNEFYKAATAGLRPEKTFIVKLYEYSGQENVIFEDTRYKVLRTYATGTEEIELICESLIGEPEGKNLVDTEMVQELKGLVEEILADDDVLMEEEKKTSYEVRLAEILEGS